ncbi:MAG: hypothetical protein FDZ69_11610 [Deltaproteobacteria bacterium]|nr:MAG: hypothetical protein FDZ69_11610 [Deltaproteobacteria bacterium]
MADGREIRAVIDTETVRGLLLINGGGAVALLAFLPWVLQKPELTGLARAIIWSVFTFQAGLVFAVVHNRFRRLCSMEYARKPENRKKCTLFGRELKEPCVCHWSTGFMWASIVAFLLAGIIVLVAGLSIVGTETKVSTGASSQPTTQGYIMPPNNSQKRTE